MKSKARPQRTKFNLLSRANDLYAYVVIVAQKSSKLFKYSYMEDLIKQTLKLIEDITRANLYRNDDAGEIILRRQYQREAMVDIGVIESILDAGTRVKNTAPPMTSSQTEYILKLTSELQTMLFRWTTNE